MKVLCHAQRNISILFALAFVFYILGVIVKAESKQRALENAGSLCLGAAISLVQGQKEERQQEQQVQRYLPRQDENTYWDG